MSIDNFFERERERESAINFKHLLSETIFAKSLGKEKKRKKKVIDY